MPRGPTQFYMVGDTAYSFKTGKELKKTPGLNEIQSGSYVQVQPEDAAAHMAGLKRTRKAKGKERYQIALDDYHNDISNVIQGYRAYIAPTKKGESRTIGKSKDSYLSALNTSMAIVNNIPLNPKNRRILGQVYADEVNAAWGVAQKAYQNHAADFQQPSVKRAAYFSQPYAPGPTKKGAANKTGTKSEAAVARRRALYKDVRLAGNPFS